jgi:hypothetical protein
LFAVLESLVLREDDGEVEHVQGGVKEESPEGESGAWEDLTKDMLYNRGEVPVGYSCTTP